MFTKKTLGICGIITVLLLLASAFSSCGDSHSNTNPEDETAATPSVSATVTKDEKFGSAILSLSEDDFKNAGFALGDSCDVVFGNGYSMTDVPFYNGYYVKTGAPVVVAYPNNKYVKIALNNREFWSAAGLSDGDTAKITLNTAGKYLATFEALGQSYSTARAEFASDEQFANFRAISVSAMKENFVYRGASPVDNEMGRAAVADSLVKAAGIKTVIDLADSDEEMQEYFASEDFTSEYTKSLYDSKNVIVLSMSSNYAADAYKENVAKGMRFLLEHGGPVYIHCLEGKDRTGFVCMLLESLVGSSYDEMRADYMKTYENYYGVTADGTPEKYNAIVSLYFDSFAEYLLGTADASADGSADSLAAANYSAAAKQYLTDCGLTETEITQLVTLLSK